MSSSNSLAERLARLRNLRPDGETLSIPAAAPINGNWPEGCQAFRASFAQARLWFLQQLEPELTAYHLPALWKLKGKLDQPALGQAINALIERHPTLRTSFRMEEGEVLQIIHPARAYPLVTEILGDRDVKDVIATWQQEERSKPFDLSAGLLIRARLLQINEREHRLLINHHHIASDGWSLSLLTRDLTAFYNAFRAGQEPELKPLSIQYHDYAGWQQQRHSDAELQKLLDYWLPQLKGVEPLELPCDHPRAATPSYQGDSISFSITAETLSGFEKLCRAQGATLQMGLLAVLAVVLHRYSNQEDFAIGIPIWGRSHPDLEGQIGFFINSLPIRTRVASQQTFRELLLQVRKTSLEAYEHQDLPFEQMVEGLQLERLNNRSPLFQVMLQLIELPDATLRNLDGLDSNNVCNCWPGADQFRSEACTLDLEFYLRRNQEGGLSGTISYSVDLFEADRILRLSTHLQTILESLQQDPDTAISQLSLLGTSEREQLEAWQQGPAIKIPNLCIHQLFEQQVVDAPEACALIFQDQQLTYAQLNDQANKLANHLIKLGIGKESIVALCLERSVELIVAVLGILKAGGAYLPLDPIYASERLRETLQDGQPQLILCDATGRQAIGEFDDAPPWITMDDPASAWRQESPQNPSCDQVGTRPDNLAYLIYTSGSTGKPKGVMLEHAGLVNLAREQGRLFDVKPESRVLQFSSISFDVATSEWATALSLGATLVLCDQNSRMSPNALSELLLKERITHLLLPAAVLPTLPLRADYALETLVVGGESCERQVADGWSRRYRMVNAYGPSEITVCSNTAEIKPNQVITIGGPVANTRVYLLDRNLQQVPIGIDGELFIGGLGVARGYLNRPELTDERFIKDPFDPQGERRLYKTGDLGRWHADGTIEYLSRNDFQIKLRGFRIEPAEIEANLLGHPAVGQVSVQLRKDDPTNPRLVAYWIVEAGEAGDLEPSAATGEELREFLSERLPDYMVPSAFVQLEAFPLTTNGKLDRRALPAPKLGVDQQDRTAPSSSLEKQLQSIWADVLGHGDFGVSDSFFSIGGHSLAAARLVSRIEQILGSDLPLTALFQNPTIQALAQWLNDGGKALDSATTCSAITTARAVSGPWPEGCHAFRASFAQARLWFLHQFQEGLTAYHMPSLWSLRGALDGEALGRALTELVKRHPTLRTSFRLEGNDPLQIIHPPGQVALQVEILEQEEPYAVVERWLREERATPFDLASGLLIRSRLLTIAPEEHLLLINHHHIASDGWSVGVMIRDLIQLYNAQREGAACDVQDLTIHYHDYAQWQRQRLSGPRLQELQEYWRNQLAELPPLELPTDHARPATPTYRGSSVSLSVEPSQLSAFEELCREEGATLQMGLLTLVGVLLNRYSRQDDFAMGVPIWGRNHPDLEPLIGFFINTLPIRARFHQQQSFRDLLRQVRNTSMEAYDHQELPFEQMVEALKLERDTSRNPLTQVVVQLIELPESSHHASRDLTIERLTTQPDAAKLDLEFEFRRNTYHGLNGTITYALDLFRHDRMERMCQHLQVMLASILDEPDRATDSLNLLPSTERALIEAWQHGPKIDIADCGIHELFDQQVEQSPGEIALIYGNQQLSYSELQKKSEAVADQLIKVGIREETIVGICLERSLPLIPVLLGILKAGGAYLPIDPNLPEERKQLLLRQAECNHLIIQENVSDQARSWAQTTGCMELGGGIHCLELKHGDDGVGKILAECRSSKNSGGHQLAYICYTSGSTGLPKGVAIEHRSIARLVHPSNEYLVQKGSVVLQLAPLAFDAATLEIWGPLLNGGTIVMAPPGKLSLKELAELLKTSKVTTLWLTAGLFHAMVEEELESLCGIKQLLAGGDVLWPEHVQRVVEAFPSGHQLINGYGPTESTTFTCCHRILAGEKIDSQKIPIGKPIAATNVKILNVAGEACPIGVPGELHIGGAGLARGYHHNETISREKFMQDYSLSSSESRLYKSGDLASWNADGTVAFHGRIDSQIKLRGFRIEPGEIETHLLSHPDVAQAIVILRKDDRSNPQLVGYWVRQISETKGDMSTQTNTEILRSYLSDRLPDYMVPSALVEMQAIPLTSNGKVNRKSLPEPIFANSNSEKVLPSREIEYKLHSLWGKTLGNADFGITENFFMVGGHSLAAARLASAIEEEFSKRLSVASIFRWPTIKEQAEHIATELDEREVVNQKHHKIWQQCLVPLQPMGSKPPLFLIHGIAGKVGHYIELAKHLAPNRPVYGIQAPEGAKGAPEQSVEKLASIYAQAILHKSGNGPIHLLGYSAGGWYAHAVATELLRHGARIGSIFILDTHDDARIPSRIKLRVTLSRLRPRLTKHIKEIFKMSGKRDQVRYFLGRIQAAKIHFIRVLESKAENAEKSGTRKLKEAALKNGGIPNPEEMYEYGDYFAELVKDYEPVPLPIKINLLTPASSRVPIKHLWCYMAQKGLTLNQLLDDHWEFMYRRNQPKVAEIIKSSILESEQESA